jgi:hypothetical protein
MLSVLFFVLGEGWVVVLAHGWLVFFFFSVLTRCRVFRPSRASDFSLLIQRKVTKRKDT